MHVELPKKGALASAKAFAGEYAMIVVSILTALALEHAAQSWHHRHRAHEAQANIETEIRANLAELRSVMQKNQQEIDKLGAVRAALREDISNNVDDQQLLNHVRESSNGKFGMNQYTPTLRREAWEVAVASQAASWIDPVLLQRYAGVYALQRDIGQSSYSSGRQMLDAPAFVNRMADVEFVKVDRTGLYYAVVQMQGALSSTQGNYAELERELVRVLPKS
ncbi:hypothetical protein [Pseudoduganella sp. OTU4001]|uniref:hypothetical protein n=1 Tax=Pseudoduganella sp. OTU4001 TaxID=3043854 RepID=UPI00313C7CAB